MLFRGIFLFMTLFLSQSSAMAKNKTPKVVVVGAGLAGLTAAHRLQQGGVDVELYEARNRVGGRVLSANVSGCVAELGGQNIADGGEAETILRLISEFHLETVEWQFSPKRSFFDEKDLIPTGQNPFDPQELREILDKLKASCHTMREVLNNLFQKDSILYRSLATRLAAYEGGSIDQLSTNSVETLFHMLSGGVSSVHQEESVNFVSIQGGNSKLPEKIANTLGTRLHLNRPLTHVAKESDGTYTLSFEKSYKVKADLIILAIPCPVFEDITFEENVIEKERLDAIQSIQYGTNAKLLIPFKGTPSDPIYLIDDHAISFFSNKSVLTKYYTGESSLFSSKTVATIYEQPSPLFEKLFEKSQFSSSPAVYAKDENFAYYTTPVGYSWPNDPYVKGSYSYTRAGQETMLAARHEENGEEFKTLFAPIGNKIYFVGEHTTLDSEIQGTLEAACESGERCARAIMNLYRTYD